MIISIDPGKSGYICFWDDNGNFLKTMSMPMLKGTKEIDYQEIKNILKNDVNLLVMEEVGFHYKASAKSIKQMGMHEGVLIGLCIAMNIPYLIVHPRTWQSKAHQGINDRKEMSSKEKSLIAMSRLFPNLKISRHDEADSILIGYWYFNFYRKK
jgi:hypothetical protein